MSNRSGQASAVVDLATLSDRELFGAVSEGIGHIIENADSLNCSALLLSSKGEHRTSSIIKGFAEEEAAKVLVLMDVVRCPRSCQKRRVVTLKRFYEHLSKRIYAEACWWRPSNYIDLISYVDASRKSHEIDGPNNYDWILGNPILSHREAEIYVDYVRDLTDENGRRSWQMPFLNGIKGSYVAPKCLDVVSALERSGSTTPGGIEIVAETWRGFNPEPGTTSAEVYRTTLAMLRRLYRSGLLHDDHCDTVYKRLDRWPFPMWHVDMKMSIVDIEQLRQEREETIAEIGLH